MSSSRFAKFAGGKLPRHILRWHWYSAQISGPNAACDGTLTLTTIFMITGLRVTTRAERAASILLGFGSIACGAAVWRIFEFRTVFAQDIDFTCKS